jgi:flagellar protein FliT
VDHGIEDYEFLSSAMGQMCAAAKEGAWARMAALEKNCSPRIAAMKAHGARAPLDETARQRKYALIRKILADDAEIRNLADPSMAQLQRILQSTTQQRRALETCNPNR